MSNWIYTNRIAIQGYASLRCANKWRIYWPKAKTRSNLKNLRNYTGENDNYAWYV